MAEQFLRVGGRSKNGLAKALRTDESGNVGVKLANDILDDVNIYDGGADGFKFVEGYSENKGVQSKESDHLYFKIEGNETTVGVRSYVIEKPIDLTNFDYIAINFEKTGSLLAFDFLVGGEKHDDQTIYEKRLRVTDNNFSGTQVLDVSDVSGEKYIKVALIDRFADSANTGEVKVYGITAKRKYGVASKVESEVVKEEKQIILVERTASTDVPVGEIFPKVEDGDEPKIEYNGYTIIDNLEWQTNTKSDMWFRVMVKVDGVWTLWNQTIRSNFSLGDIYNPERIVNGNSFFEILEFDDNKKFYKFAIKNPIIAPEGIQIYFENRSTTTAYKAGLTGTGRVLL